MRYLFACFLMVSSISLSACGPAQETRVDPAEESWEQLFDGATLTGWTPKIRGYEFGDNFAETFRVADGVIQVSYDGYDSFDERFGHLFYEKPYSYYKMAVEYRFTGEQAPGGPGWAYRNSGIMIHSPAGETMLTDQDFPISIEVQLLGGNGTDERTNANLCTPGTHVVMDDVLVTRHCVNSTSRTYHGDDWVRAEIVVLGDSLISHILEGETVLQYSKPQIGGGSVDPFDPAIKIDGQLLTGGYFSLQSESHPVEFRKVELLNLKGCMNPEALNYKTYFIADDPASCMF
jgi:hypothetical protein